MKNLESVKTTEDLRKRLIQLPSFRVSSVSSDFGGKALEYVDSRKLKRICRGMGTRDGSVSRTSEFDSRSLGHGD